MKKMLGFMVVMTVANAIGNAMAYEIVLKRFMNKEKLKEITKVSFEASREIMDEMDEL